MYNTYRYEYSTVQQYIKNSRINFRKAAFERLLSKGCFRKAAFERLLSKGCFRKAAFERLLSKGCIRKDPFERMSGSHMNNHAACAAACAATSAAACAAACGKVCRKRHHANRSAQAAWAQSRAIANILALRSEIAGNSIAPFVVMQRCNCSPIYSTRYVPRPAAKYEPACGCCLRLAAKYEPAFTVSS